MDVRTALTIATLWLSRAPPADTPVTWPQTLEPIHLRQQRRHGQLPRDLDADWYIPDEATLAALFTLLSYPWAWRLVRALTNRLGNIGRPRRKAIAVNVDAVAIEGARTLDELAQNGKAVVDALHDDKENGNGHPVPPDPAPHEKDASSDDDAPTPTPPKPKERSPRRLRSIFSFFSPNTLAQPSSTNSDLPPIQGVSFDDAALKAVGGPTPPELERTLQAALGSEHLNLDDWTDGSASRSLLTPKSELDVSLGVVPSDKTPAEEIVALVDGIAKQPEQGTVDEHPSAATPREPTPELPQGNASSSQVLSDSGELMGSAVLVEPEEGIVVQQEEVVAQHELDAVAQQAQDAVTQQDQDAVAHQDQQPVELEPHVDEPRTPTRPSTPTFVPATSPSQVSTTPSSFVDLQSPFTEDEDQAGSPFTVVDASSPEQSLHIQRARAPSPPSPTPAERAYRTPSPDSPVGSQHHTQNLPPIVVPPARPISGRRRFAAPPSLAAVQPVLPPAVSLSLSSQEQAEEEERLGDAEAMGRAKRPHRPGGGGDEKKGKGSASPGWMRMGEGTRPLVWFMDGPAQFGSQPPLRGHEEDEDEDDYDDDFEYDEDEDVLEEGEIDGEPLDYGVPDAGVLEDVYEEEEEEEEEEAGAPDAPTLQVRNWTDADADADADEEEEDERTVTMRPVPVTAAPVQETDREAELDEELETRSNVSVPDIVVSVAPEGDVAVDVVEASGPPVGSVRRAEQPEDEEVEEEEDMEEVAIAQASAEGEPFLVEEQLEVDDVLPEEGDHVAIADVEEVAPAPVTEEVAFVEETAAPGPEPIVEEAAAAEEAASPHEPVAQASAADPEAAVPVNEVESAEAAAAVAESAPAAEDGGGAEESAPLVEPEPAAEEHVSVEVAPVDPETAAPTEPVMEDAALVDETPAAAGVVEEPSPADKQAVAQSVEDEAPAADESPASEPVDEESPAPAEDAVPVVDEPTAEVEEAVPSPVVDEEPTLGDSAELVEAAVARDGPAADEESVPTPTDPSDAPAEERAVDSPVSAEDLSTAPESESSSTLEDAAPAAASDASPAAEEHAAAVDEAAPAEQAVEEVSEVPASADDEDEGVLVEVPTSKEPTPAPEEANSEEPEVSPAEDTSPESAQPVVFSLKGKGLKFNNADDLELHLKELPDLSNVTEICLSGNTLGVEAANSLADSIRSMTSLRIATLSDLFTGRLDTEIPLALAAICQALSESKTLVEFNVSDNAIGKYADALVPLFTKNSSIRVLKLNNLGFGPYAGNVVADALTSAVSQGQQSNLRIMVSGRHHIENGAAPAWGRMFAAHGGLTGIDLQSAWIGAAGFREIASGLAHCKGLRYLNLDDNLGRDSEEDAWPAFAEALRAWTRLRFCNVASCRMENEGAQAILDVLAEGKHSELHTLVLDNSDLTEDVYGQLRDVVEQHLPALRILSISDNDDIEENDDVEAIGRIMEEREGELILEEDLERRWPEPVDEPDALDEAIMAATANTDAAADAIASEIKDALSYPAEDVSAKKED